MNKLLSAAAFGIVMSLAGCQPANQAALSTSSAASEESMTTMESLSSTAAETQNKQNQAWEDMEWKEVVLQLPVVMNKMYDTDTFQSADQTDELGGLELMVHTWQGDWSDVSFCL